MLNSWLMLNQNEIVSQFDRNFAQTVDEKEVVDQTGVTYHKVN